MAAAAVALNTDLMPVYLLRVGLVNVSRNSECSLRLCPVHTIDVTLENIQGHISVCNGGNVNSRDVDD